MSISLPSSRPGVGTWTLRTCLLACTIITTVANARTAESQPALRHAQSHAPHRQTNPDQVVVTGSSRANAAHRAPSSTTIVGAQALQARGITSLASLAQSTPGVSLKSEGPSQTEIEMRGMSGSGGNSPTVGFYLGGVPLSGPAGAQNGHVVIDPSLYDLNGIEMTRGPQGTQYGQMAMGGNVRLFPSTPDTHALHASAQSILSGTQGGGFNHNDNLMANLPLIRDKLALRWVGSENYTSGWIDRIVGGNFPVVQDNGATRGNVAAAPILARYPGANASQTYATRVALNYTPTNQLTIMPSYFFETSRQNGISAFDSTPGSLAHYQPFDIAEPLTDQISLYSLDLVYRFDGFAAHSTTGFWSRRSTQTEDASENFNNPQTGATYAANYGLSNPGYDLPGGSYEAYGHEIDPSKQYSEDLNFHATDHGRLSWNAGMFFSFFSSVWNFTGTTPNPSAYMDLGTFAPATTPHWFDAHSPTHQAQYAAYGSMAYAITRKLKVEMGLRLTRYDYRFSSCLSGWGTGYGAAQASCTGTIHLRTQTATPNFNLSYQIDDERMIYARIANATRPAGGNSIYPTTGAYWSSVFAPYHFAGGTWPRTYKPDSVWTYELGEKARFLNRHLTLDADIYYEDWQRPQIVAYPGDWALNINGRHAQIYGGEAAAQLALGHGFNLQLSGSLLHARLDGGPHWLIQPGNRLPEIAPAVGSAIFNYSHAISRDYTVTATIENAYTGHRYSLAFPYGASTNGAYIRMPSYDLTNLRVGLRAARGWNASLFVNNVLNKHAKLESLFQEALPSAAFNRIVTNQPLTGGLEIAAHF